MRGTTPSDSAVGPIRAGHGFDGARLAEYLAARLPGFGAGLAVQQFRGGQSCPTYRLETAGKRYVLRRKPPGRLLPTAHAIEREFLVLRALAGSAVPVPEALLLCEDPAVIGTPFYVMAEVPGRIFWDLTLPDVAATERAALYDAMNATIAALHRLDPVALGLGDYGRPAGYVARQIERWTAQYRASETETIPAMERLIAWLPAHLPPDTAAALVHGDFRLDNLIFAADEPRVVAVLDWEVSTLGDPLADFAYHCMMWRLPPDAFQGLRGVDLDCLGIPSENEYVARYCRRTGSGAIPHWDFYIAYNMFRLAAILQGITGRVRDGTATSATAEARGRMARAVAEAGWREVEALMRR